MHRLSNGTQTNTAPTPPAVQGTPGYPTSGNPGTGAPSSIIDAYQAFTVQEEISHVIENAGIALDKTNNGQLLQALAAQFETVLGFTPVKQNEGNDNEVHAVSLGWNPVQPNAGNARLQLMVDSAVIGNVLTDFKGTVTSAGAYVELPLFGSVKMVIQLGASSTGPSGSQTVNFPEAFGTSVIALFACATSIPGPGSNLTVSVGTPTSTPLQTMTVYSSNSGTVPFSWLAIGIS